MATTYEILKAESKRLRALAEKIDSFAAELQSETSISTQIQIPQRQPTPALPPSLPGIGEFADMKQAEAIIHALKTYGPQTTKQLFERLNAGGLSFKKVAYVTAILARFKDKWDRAADGKISLKQGV
jgi:hypothetical protein